MEKTTSQVLKDMASWIIVSSVLVAAINWLFSILGISFGTGIADIITQNMAGSMPNYMGPTPEATSGGIVVLQNIAGLFVLGVTGLVSAALSLGVYRNLRYDTKMRFEDLFYFFNRNFLMNVLACILINLISSIGFVLFIVPGIIASLGLLPWGIWLGMHQQDEKVRPKEVIADAWNSTKGKKGMIFGNYILYILIMIALFVLFGVMFIGIFSGGDPTVSGSIFALLLGIILLIVISIVAYIPIINSFRGLAEAGVFDPKQEIVIDDMDDHIIF